MKEWYVQANKIVTSETYVEEFLDEVDIDEDSAFTYGKLVLLADSRTGSQKTKDDVAPEMQSKVKRGNETEEGLFVVEYENNGQ